METIILKDLPPPNGHYSHAVRHNDTLYVSGILPGGLSPDSPLEEQFTRVFDTIESILANSGATLNQIISCHIYTPDLEMWPEINRLYAERLGEHKPARVVVPVKELHFGYKLEVEVVVALQP